MASPDPQDSPLSSEHDLDPNNLSLDQLVDVFLASKRSLSCVNQVWRARDIVDTGRDAVEENAILAAKNSFVRYAVDVQMESLEAIKHGSSLVQAEGRQELQVRLTQCYMLGIHGLLFHVQDTIKALDEASARLNATLDSLRNTNVDSSFREPEEELKCLFDFVDEAGVNDLYDSIKQSMHRFDEAQKTFSDTCSSYDDVLANAQETLEVDQEDVSKSQGFALEGPSPVPSFFYSLETHATEVASNLQGLVKHYDLCKAALRNTEGGGEAISKASQEETATQESKLEGFGLGITRIDEETPLEEFAEDRTAMLAVIIQDAREVDDVIDEIKERLAEMEDQVVRIQAYIEMLRSTSERLRHTHLMLKQLLDQIPEYVSACAIFQQAWEEEKGILTTRVDEIEGLTEFYTGFAAGYDNLIIEVHRRRKVRREMEKVVSSALSQIDKMYKGKCV
jgi:autophagy-related protein 17